MIPSLPLRVLTRTLRGLNNRRTMPSLKRRPNAMTPKILVITLSLLFAAMLYAQGNKSVTITGNLIDNACAESAKDLDTKAKNHSTSCALMEKCQSSGYAVYADHKLYKLDDKGNDSAADLLKNTKTTKGVKVAVEGTVEGDTIHVTKLTEVTESVN